MALKSFIRRFIIYETDIKALNEVIDALTNNIQVLPTAKSSNILWDCIDTISDNNHYYPDYQIEIQ